MVTIMKKQKVTLNYLEQVRQHLSRLPQIDPDGRTLVLTGINIFFNLILKNLF